ncbi:MAG TPA: hypothetical protein VF116_16890 [Ktedonobacterales bacterium]
MPRVARAVALQCILRADGYTPDPIGHPAQAVFGVLALESEPVDPRL